MTKEELEVVKQMVEALTDYTQKFGDCGMVYDNAKKALSTAKRIFGLGGEKP